jgi:GT2 family glycosyltransferase
MSDLGAVILHYRHWPDVAVTIEAAIAQGLEPSMLRIVDNASGDGSLEAIREHFPRLVDSIVALPDNGGYGAGMNAGIRSLPECDVLLLTHETVLSPDSLDALRARLRDDPTIGMVGPLLTYRDAPATIYAEGGLFNRRMGIGHIHDGEPLDAHRNDEPRDVGWLDGACLLIRGAALRDVGPFDEDYFLYYEETDFAARMALRRWRIECAPTARASQQPGTLPRALWVRNRLRFLRRNASTRWFLRQLVVDARTCITGPDRAMTARGIVGFLVGTDPRVLHAHSSRPAREFSR